ncbi:MAG: proprotein convertase P-domain-containing protein [Chloroflexia bacterium]
MKHPSFVRERRRPLLSAARVEVEADSATRVRSGVAIAFGIVCFLACVVGALQVPVAPTWATSQSRAAVGVRPSGFDTIARAEQCGYTSFFSPDVPQVICDLCTVTATVQVTVSGAIGDINVVGINISHTHDSDLTIKLVSPAGTVVTLIGRVCLTSQGFSDISLDDAAEFEIGYSCPPVPGGTYRPGGVGAGTLATFNGEASAGTWSLVISDAALRDVGSLNAWGLQILTTDCLTATPTPTYTQTTTPTRTPTPTATVPCATVRAGNISQTDPTFTRPAEFFQGGMCFPDTGGVHYDYYEFQLAAPAGVVASLCPSDGGSAAYDSFLVIYQAADGSRRNPFQPSACLEAVTANDDSCGQQSRVSANLVAGYFYVVVTQFGTSDLGSYNLAVLGPMNCPTGSPTSTATATPSSTPSATPTRTITPTQTTTPPRTATATVAPDNAVLVVHVTWQGITQPSSRNTTETVTATLRLLPNGLATEYAGYTTDAGGFFTLPVAALPAGTYLIRVKGSRNLSNGDGACGDAVTLAGAPVTSYDAGPMRAGDAMNVGVTNFNVVNSIDFTVLKATFGKSYSQPGYDARADFDNNDVVNSTDFTLLKGNFGQSGCGPGV